MGRREEGRKGEKENQINDEMERWMDELMEGREGETEKERKERMNGCNLSLQKPMCKQL